MAVRRANAGAARGAVRRGVIVAALAGMMAAMTTTHAAEPLESWAGLARYRAANAALPSPAAGVARVVFFGDSITEAWSLPAIPAGARREYVNRGIGGQTTAQMLLRFRADVLALEPRAVVLLAGTNDLAGNIGPTTVPEIAGRLRSMVQLARAAGVRVLLCSVLPASAYPWASAVKPALDIVALNAVLRRIAQDEGVAWVDYHAALADAQGGLPREWADDGVHPNAAAYARMTALLAPALDAALKE